MASGPPVARADHVPPVTAHVAIRYTVDGSPPLAVRMRPATWPGTLGGAEVRRCVEADNLDRPIGQYEVRTLDGEGAPVVGARLRDADQIALPPPDAAGNIIVGLNLRLTADAPRVILSCVVSGQRRSFLEDRRRMNVAISRAKKTLDVVGHPALPHNNASIGALHASTGGVEVAFILGSWPVEWSRKLGFVNRLHFLLK